MTAQPGRRRRRTVVVGVLAVVLVVAAAAGFVVGVVTLTNSQEGEAVGVDDRPRIELPDTPNGLLVVVGADGELASLAVATLLPDGTGGSLALVPTNADVNAGFGDEPQTVGAAWSSVDPTDDTELEEFATEVGAMLSIAIDQTGVYDGPALVAALAPIDLVEAELPVAVLDSDAIGSGVVSEAGDQVLRRSEAVDALVAVDAFLSPIDQHALDVAVWTALVAATPVGDVDVTPATDGSVPPPSSFEELLERLLAGPVIARDLALAEVLADPSGDLGGEVAVVDRRDALLVFGQVSPTRVLTPNAALTFRIDSDITEGQLAASDVKFESIPEMMRNLIGELLFFQSNPVSIDSVPGDDPAEVVTRLEVTQQQFVSDVEALAEFVFGEFEVVLADEVIEGIDVVVTLGTGYLDFRTAVDAAMIEDPAAEDPAETGSSVDSDDGGDGG
ncbi:MAG: hypothetical protein HRT86_03545 [Ilumatobacteraceae bacterium]|nr:hypothetical protein [Ilumatobacteraceae bacterium]